MFLYAFLIPVLDQFTTVAVQWLENIKGQLMVKAQSIQNNLNDLSATEEITDGTVTNVIGFQLPEEQEYYEEDYEEDD